MNKIGIVDYYISNSFFRLAGPSHTNAGQNLNPSLQCLNTGPSLNTRKESPQGLGQGAGAKRKEYWKEVAETSVETANQDLSP